ncbi:MAG: TraR/DksA C4-type zinc finger protein [Armatimonadetes bacterium]|nr:TraR/DksA C4-type zinc finger protein [Armatimonadota bacterium]
MNLAVTKADLLEERQRLIEERDEVDESNSERRQSEEIGELSDYGDHPGDTGSSTFERERDIALSDNVESLIEKIDRALEKIEEGTYGTCDRCGTPIAPERLEAMPSASLCLKCQDMEDGL